MMGRRCYVLLRRRYDVPIRRRRDTTETSWQRSIETSLGVSFGTYLRRRWDVQRDVVTTPPQRLTAGWVIILGYVILYQTRTAHHLKRRITSTL